MSKLTSFKGVKWHEHTCTTDVKGKNAWAYEKGNDLGIEQIFWPNATELEPILPCSKLKIPERDIFHLKMNYATVWVFWADFFWPLLSTFKSIPSTWAEIRRCPTFFYIEFLEKGSRNEVTVFFWFQLNFYSSYGVSVCASWWERPLLNSTKVASYLWPYTMSSYSQYSSTSPCKYRVGLMNTYFQLFSDLSIFVCAPRFS